MCDLDQGIIETGMKYRQAVSALRKIDGFAQSHSIPSYDRHSWSYSFPLKVQLSDAQLEVITLNARIGQRFGEEPLIDRLEASVLGRFIQPKYVPMARLQLRVFPDDSVNLRTEGDLAVGREFLRVPADYSSLPSFCSDMQTREQKDALNALASRVAVAVNGVRK